MISVSSLKKSFGTVDALKGISFSIPQGECYGLLGPNACSGFGVVLASFAKTRQQVQGFSSIIVLVMSAIGGSMIPLFVMPEIMQKIAVFTVNYWGYKGFMTSSGNLFRLQI